MDFILENYIIIIFVGLFFVFALIGYLIDMLRKPKEEIKKDISEIKPVEIKDIELPKEGIKEIIDSNNSNSKEKNNDADDLLKNYDESITE